MTKNVLEGSDDKDDAKQLALVERHAKWTSLPYENPHVLEATASIVMHHAKTGENLFGDYYIHCQERTVEGPIAVGGFSGRYLTVLGARYNEYGDEIGSVGAAPKLRVSS